MLALGRVAEILAEPGRTRTIPAVHAKRDPLAARHGMDVHVGAASRAEKQPLFVAGLETGPQQVAAGCDPPTAIAATHDQRPDPLFAHLGTRALRGLVGADGDGSRHVIADGTPREGVGQIASDADDANRKTPLRDHQVLNPKGGRNSKGFGDGNVRSDRHRPVTHDISNTHTAPKRTEIDTEIGKQAKRRSCGHITTIAADFLAPEMDVKL